MKFDAAKHIEREVAIPAGSARLAGDLSVPASARGIALFAHGSGSSRHSSRNRLVASALQAAGIGTLLFDLLTRDEEAIDLHTREYRFDIPLLADRLVEASRWVETVSEIRELPLGYFGASTGSAAALIAAAKLGHRVGAVVSRGGRPDLAHEHLAAVTAPTLLIVGGDDHGVIELNRQAYDRLRCEKDLRIVPGASHLFEEPGTLEAAARLAADWLAAHLQLQPSHHA
jgi:alpha-beta hydrolase superfamily lysophospholipase